MPVGCRYLKSFSHHQTVQKLSNNFHTYHFCIRAIFWAVEKKLPVGDLASFSQKSGQKRPKMGKFDQFSTIFSKKCVKTTKIPMTLSVIGIDLEVKKTWEKVHSNRDDVNNRFFTKLSMCTQQAQMVHHFGLIVDLPTKIDTKRAFVPYVCKYLRFHITHILGNKICYISCTYVFFIGSIFWAVESWQNKKLNL